VEASNIAIEIVIADGSAVSRKTMLAPVRWQASLDDHAPRVL
jgi:hypothetical protein